jgi:hypothetical protein
MRMANGGMAPASCSAAMCPTASQVSRGVRNARTCARGGVLVRYECLFARMWAKHVCMGV